MNSPLFDGQPGPHKSYPKPKESMTFSAIKPQPTELQFALIAFGEVLLHEIVNITTDDTTKQHRLLMLPHQLCSILCCPPLPQATILETIREKPDYQIILTPGETLYKTKLYCIAPGNTAVLIPSI